MSGRLRKRLDRIPDPKDAKPKVRPCLMELPDGTVYRGDDPNETPMTPQQVEAHHTKYGECVVWVFVDSGHNEQGLSSNGVAALTLENGRG